MRKVEMTTKSLVELKKDAKELGVLKYYTMKKDLLVKEIAKKEKENKKKTREFCVHKIEKKDCKNCCSKSICKHGKKLATCKKCKGVSGNNICSHDKYKYVCKECKGSQICIHNKQRISCKDCKRAKFITFYNNIRKREKLSSIEAYDKYMTTVS